MGCAPCQRTVNSHSKLTPTGDLIHGPWQPEFCSVLPRPSGNVASTCFTRHNERDHMGTRVKFQNTEALLTGSLCCWGISFLIRISLTSPLLLFMQEKQQDGCLIGFGWNSVILLQFYCCLEWKDQLQAVFYEWPVSTGQIMQCLLRSLELVLYARLSLLWKHFVHSTSYFLFGTWLIDWLTMIMMTFCHLTNSFAWQNMSFGSRRSWRVEVQTFWKRQTSLCEWLNHPILTDPKYRITTVGGIKHLLLFLLCGQDALVTQKETFGASAGLNEPHVLLKPDIGPSECLSSVLSLSFGWVCLKNLLEDTWISNCLIRLKQNNQ